MHFSAAVTQLTCSHLGDQGQLWHEDALELFLQPDPSRDLYLEVECAPDGAILLLLVAGRGRNRRRWEPWRHNSSGVTARCRHTRTRWTAHLHIPFTLLAGLAPKPRPGSEWRGNITRAGHETGASTLSSLVPMGRADFHQPDYFVPLIFAP